MGDAAEQLEDFEWRQTNPRMEEPMMSEAINPSVEDDEIPMPEHDAEKALAVVQKAQPPALPANIRQSAELPAVYRGISQCPITPEESKALMADFEDSDFEIRAHDGQVYLGNAAQRRRLNEVFGAGQWGLLPLGDMVIQDMRNKKEISREWGLYVRGCLISTAWGSQNYIPANDQMSHADAIEGCRSDGLKKNCKDLGLASNQAFNPIWREDWKKRCCRQKSGKWYTIWQLDGGDAEPSQPARKGMDQARREPAPAPAKPAPAPAPAQPRQPESRSGDAGDDQPEIGPVPEGWRVGWVKQLYRNTGKSGKEWFKADMLVHGSGKQVSFSTFDTNHADDLAAAKEQNYPVYFRASQNKDGYWNFMEVSLVNPTPDFDDPAPAGE